MTLRLVTALASVLLLSGCGIPSPCEKIEYRHGCLHDAGLRVFACRKSGTRWDSVMAPCGGIDYNWKRLDVYLLEFPFQVTEDPRDLLASASKLYSKSIKGIASVDYIEMIDAMKDLPEAPLRSKFYGESDVISAGAKAPTPALAPAELKEIEDAGIARGDIHMVFRTPVHRFLLTKTFSNHKKKVEFYCLETGKRFTFPSAWFDSGGYFPAFLKDNTCAFLARKDLYIHNAVVHWNPRTGDVKIWDYETPPSRRDLEKFVKE